MEESGFPYFEKINMEHENFIKPCVNTRGEQSSVSCTKNLIVNDVQWWILYIN